MDATTTIGAWFSTLLLGPVLQVLLTFVVCLIGVRLLRALGDKLLDRTHIEGSLRSFLRSALHVILWALAIVIVAGSLGIETASLVAVLSVAGLALSLSMQGTLSNLFSGVTLLGVKPFAAGDFVELGAHSGVIKSITLFYTTLSTPDNKLIFVPNNEVANSRIVNYSHEPTRRVDLTIAADYAEPTEKVRAALQAAIDSVPQILKDPEPFISISNYGDNAIEYVVRVWTNSPDYWTVHFGLNEAVRTSFEERGVAMSYPHMNVHIMR
ncbi:MAG: mechanosensitive ion channel [Eubacteriales bacterium]|nr:mechanosensitive ion channel [Eubacteriales bacterium]